jgi:hypothetical protein
MMSLGDILKSVVSPLVVIVDSQSYELFVIQHENGFSCYCQANGITATGKDNISMLAEFRQRVKMAYNFNLEPWLGCCGGGCDASRQGSLFARNSK